MVSTNEKQMCAVCGPERGEVNLGRREHSARSQKSTLLSRDRLNVLAQPDTVREDVFGIAQDGSKQPLPGEGYFPDFPYENITIRMLLSHRSGLPEYMYFADKLWPSRSKPITNQDVLSLMIKFKPYKYYDPGKRYNYSNTNYCLLVLIIEKVSGMTFENFMKSQIFEPLGMNNSYVLRYEDIKEPEIENVVVGYNKRGRRAENSYLNGVVGDKGIFSTVEDLFKWDTAIYQGRLVSKETMEEAFKPAHKDLRLNDNYGFGWRINENDGDKIVFHSGWWKGFRTYYIRKLSEQKTIIVLTNTARHNFISIRKLTGLI